MKKKRGSMFRMFSWILASGLALMYSFGKIRAKLEKKKEKRREE